MPQTRIGNFGETATSANENEFRRIAFPKGVYEGFDLGVDSFTNLTIDLGAGIQHNGVSWFESTVLTLGFIPPGIPEDFTVVALHDNRQVFGGVSVVYELQAGILSDVTNGVILGWIRHPGGGASLDPLHIQEAPKIRSDLYSALLVETASIEIVPGYPRAFLDTASLGVNITFTEQKFDIPTFTMFQHIERSLVGAPGSQVAVQHIQFYVGDGGWRPIGFDFWLNFPSAPSRELRVEVFDTAQSPVSVVGSPITGTTGWEKKSVELADLTSGTFTVGNPWTLRLTFEVNQGGEIKIGRTRARFWPFQ